MLLRAAYYIQEVMMLDNGKIAIYSRKSKFTGKGESIDNQIELCKTYIKNKFPDIDDDDIVVFEDEGYSGKNTKRPQFQQMLKAVKERKITRVVCYRLDRISRNVGDFSLLIDELNEYDIAFDSINEKFDTSNPMGKAMMYICSIFAQLERETIAERIKDNMHELAKTGRWLGGTTPTGYKSEKIVERINTDGKNITACKLEPVADEIELVKLIYSKFIEFNSLSATQTYLLKNNIKTKNGKSFTRFTIKSILQNPVYMIADDDAWNYFEKAGVDVYSHKADFNGVNGLMGYNKTLQKSGKTNTVRRVDEWIISVGKHPGIISGSDWVMVQNYLEQNVSKSYRKPRSHTALLSGLIVCSKCGGYMRPKIYNRDFGDNERRFGYLCETKEKTRQHNCDMKNPNGNMLDKMVVDEIKKFPQNDREFIKLLESRRGEITSKSDDFEKQVKTQENIISEKRGRINNLINNIANVTSGISIRYINEKIEKLDEEIKTAQIYLDSLRELTTETILSEDETKILKSHLTNFAQIFDTMTTEQKRLVIRSLIQKIVWDGENVHIYTSGSKFIAQHLKLFKRHTEPMSEDSK